MVWYYLPIQVALWCSCAICQKKRWIIAPMCGLLRPKLTDLQGQIPYSSPEQSPRYPQKGMNILKDRLEQCLLFSIYYQGRQVENGSLHSLWVLQVVGDAI